MACLVRTMYQLIWWWAKSGSLLKGWPQGGVKKLWMCFLCWERLVLEVWCCLPSHRLVTRLPFSGVQTALMLSRQPLPHDSERAMGTNSFSDHSAVLSISYVFRFKVWHFSGSLMTQHDTPPKHELWEVRKVGLSRFDLSSYIWIVAYS